MKINRFVLGWTLVGFLLIITLTNGLETDDKDNQELVETAVRDTSMRPKRPFCNAFTGCGKKRSYNGNALERKEEQKKIQVPIEIYRAMIHDLSEEIRNAIEYESEQSPDQIEQDYSPYSTRRIPIRKRYQT